MSLFFLLPLDNEHQGHPIQQRHPPKKDVVTSPVFLPAIMWLLTCRIQHYGHGKQCHLSARPTDTVEVQTAQCTFRIQITGWYFEPRTRRVSTQAIGNFRYTKLKCFHFNNFQDFNPLKPELNPICYLLALLGAHHFLHVSRIKVKLLTFRKLMSYIYGAPILDVSRSHTTTQHSR